MALSSINSILILTRSENISGFPMFVFGSRPPINPCGVEGTHNFLGNSENTDSIRHAKGELGLAPVLTPTLETNKQGFKFVKASLLVYRASK